MAHYEGSPDGCRENCPGPHIGDDIKAPDVCPECGGNGRACKFGCQHTSRAYEPFEGRTGADEYRADECAGQSSLF